MTPLKLFGREEERRAAWQNLVVDVQNRDVRTARLNILFSAANAFVFGIENLAVMAIGARVVMSGQNGSGPVFSVGMLMAFLAYRGQFSSRVSALINDAVDFKMLQLHAERLADIALTMPERDHPQLSGHEARAPMDDLAHLEPSIELRGVGFRYGDGEPWIVRGVDWFVGAGECVALTGPSGCGKTTVLKIMLGLLQPTEGEVLYGGVPLRQLGIRNVRRLLGTVMQEDVLLTGSIEENIAFFDAQPDRTRVEAAARMARIHADVLRMPMGYRTLLGDLGAGLSGGQRQRILLARALCKQPRILALDEATSHLDEENERAINAELIELRITRLVIAHRAETIAAAQRLAVIRDRAIVDIRSLAGGARDERVAVTAATGADA
jgi:ATP-binding cassette subfamily B protein RaxB